VHVIVCERFVKIYNDISVRCIIIVIIVVEFGLMCLRHSYFFLLLCNF